MQGAKVVRLVAATLAAIAFYSGLLSLMQPARTDVLEGEVTDSLQRYELSPGVPFLRFIITATSLNPGERRIQASLMSLPVKPDLFPDIVDSSGKPVFQDGVVRPEFADAKLDVLLSNSSLGTTTVSYPLANVTSTSAPSDARRVNVSIPVRADPYQFPNDSYALDLTLVVTLPPALAVHLPRPHDSDRPLFDGSTRYLPTSFKVAVDSRLGQWSVDMSEGAQVKYPNATSDSHVTGLGVQFRRTWTYWAFVYAVSLMPAVIGLSFVVRTRRLRGATDTSAAMELAAALLALIALRQVFVPTDITGLTRLDFVLGVQLLAVCWLMAVTYVADPQPTATTPASTRPAPRTRRRLTPRPPDGAVRRIT